MKKEWLTTIEAKTESLKTISASLDNINELISNMMHNGIHQENISNYIKQVGFDELKADRAKLVNAIANHATGD